MPWLKDEIYTKEFCDKEADALLEYAENATVPLLSEFCYKRGYDQSRVSQFLAKKSEKFEKVVKLIKEKQQSALIKGGLSNKFNNAMATFCLKNNHGWADKLDQSTTHKGEISLTKLLGSDDK